MTVFPFYKLSCSFEMCPAAVRKISLTYQLTELTFLDGISHTAHRKLISTAPCHGRDRTPIALRGWSSWMTSDLISRYQTFKNKSKMATVLSGCFVVLPSLNWIPQKCSVCSELASKVL
jgi:hypothetical protein